MIPSYLINLDQDTERLTVCQRAFGELGIHLTRISGVDGRRFSEEDFRKFQEQRPRGSNKRWLRGQMGCFLSHFKAWQLVAQNNARFAAIFEDDIHISEDLGALLKEDSWLPDDIDLVRLEPSTNRVRLANEARITRCERGFYPLQSTSWCTGAYLIHKRAAQRLIALPVAEHHPSDVMLWSFEQSALAKQFTILQCDPAPCIQDKFLNAAKPRFGSNIEQQALSAARWKRNLAKLDSGSLIAAVRRRLNGYNRVTYR